jgi:hypothetical protein
VKTPALLAADNVVCETFADQWQGSDLFFGAFTVAVKAFLFQ